MSVLKLFVYGCFCLLSTATYAADSDKFDVFSYRVECISKYGINDFMENLSENMDSSNLKYCGCERYDTLLDSEAIHIPYQNIVVRKNAIVLQSNDNKFSLSTEFIFDTLTPVYSSLQFRKAWDSCGDTVWGDTDIQKRFYFNCVKSDGCTSIKQKAFKIKRYQDMLFIKYQDGSSFYIINIPIKSIENAEKSFFVTGIPDSGKPHQLNGNLGFFDTVLIKDDRNGHHGSTVYIQKNHKASFYNSINCNYPDVSNNDGYRESVRKMKSQKFKKNNMGSIPTKWLQVHPFQNELYLSFLFSSTLNETYFLSDSAITHLYILPKRPEIRPYRLAQDKMKYSKLILTNNNDTIGRIIFIDSVHTDSVVPILGLKKVLIPCTSIQNFDILVQETNPEAPQLFKFEGIKVNEAIKILRNKNVGFVFLLN